MSVVRGQRWDIFCAVIDNFGDIGVSWRLARQLAVEHGLKVRLWVDELASLQPILPEISPGLAAQTAAGVEVRHWPSSFPPVQPAEVVIEAFGCELPPAYVEAMAALPRQPVWINLEYLSAEKWVGECHGLSSPHPRLPLLKYFFFPGFTPETGGLLLESGLVQRRRAFQGSTERKNAFWQSIGLMPPKPDESRISLFGYENSALTGLLAAWSASPTPVTCLVPEGRMVAGVASFLGLSGLECGRDHTRGNLTVRVLPFMDQLRYDEFLWACDCNFVRGEDSFVRAQWAARPFVWHIYPQQEDAHWVKLQAFLDRYCAALPAEAASGVRAFWEAWNGGRALSPNSLPGGVPAGSIPAGIGSKAAQSGEKRDEDSLREVSIKGAGEAWPGFWRHRAVLERHAQQWADDLSSQGGLAANLVQFCNNRL